MGVGLTSFLWGLSHFVSKVLFFAIFSALHFCSNLFLLHLLEFSIDTTVRTLQSWQTHHTAECSSKSPISLVANRTKY